MNFRHNAQVGWLAALSICLVVACRNDEPPPPPAEESAQQTAPVEGPVRMPGAEARKPRSEPPPPVAARVPPRETAREPVDAQRSSVPPTPPPSAFEGGPTYLPASGQVADWVRSQAVEVVSAGELSRLFAPESAARMQHFGIRSAVRCRYERREGGRTCAADVLAIEASSPADAYGLTTIRSASGESEPCGGLTRVERGRGLAFHTWQGVVSIQAVLDGKEPADIDAFRRLVQQIVSRIPREEPPALLHALPVSGQVHGRSWLVRHLGSVTPSAIPVQPLPDYAEFSRLLKLGPQTLMGIACYEVPRARQPNTVWVVEFPTAAAANEAHGALSSALVSATSPAWLSCNVMPPKGRYLVGTWTAEEESLQKMMLRMSVLLPAP
jgi:hypothetical protein